MSDKDVLPEKNWLERATALKRFEYYPLCKELKKQTSVAEKHYQKCESKKIEEDNEKQKRLC